MNRFNSFTHMLEYYYANDNPKIIESNSYIIQNILTDVLNAFIPQRRSLFISGFYKERANSFDFELMETSFNTIRHYSEIDADNLLRFAFIAGWHYFEKRKITIEEHLNEIIDFGELGKFSRLDISKMPYGNNWIRYSLSSGDTYWQGW